MKPTALSLDAPTPLLRRLSRLLTGQLRAVLQGAAQVLAIRVLGAGLTYASMVLLARWLGAYDFGIYAYVLVIVMLLGLAFSFGFSSSGLRFVSSYLARKKLQRLSGFLRHTFTIVLLLSLVGSLAAAGLLVLNRDTIGEAYVQPMLIGLLCVPVWTLLNQLEATARAFGWVHIAYVPGYVLRPFLLTSFVGAMMLLGGKVDAVSALWAMAGACALVALTQGVIVFIGARKHLASIKPVIHARHWFAVSLSFLMIDGFRMLLDNVDVLLIGRLLDPQSVAVYFAVIRTAGLVGFVSFSVIALAVPKFAQIHSTGTRQELQTFVTEMVQLMFWPSLLAAVALAVLGPFLLSLFGAGFGAGYPTMLVVLTGLVLRAATLPVEYLLNMTGYHRDTMRVYAVAALANVILNLLLIPAFGILGAAIATYTAMLGGNLWLHQLIRRRLGINASIFSMLMRPEISVPKIPAGSAQL